MAREKRPISPRVQAALVALHGGRTYRQFAFAHFIRGQCGLWFPASTLKRVEAGERAPSALLIYAVERVARLPPGSVLADYAGDALKATRRSTSASHDGSQEVVRLHTVQPSDKDSVSKGAAYGGADHVLPVAGHEHDLAIVALQRIYAVFSEVGFALAQHGVTFAVGGQGASAGTVESDLAHGTGDVSRRSDSAADHAQSTTGSSGTTRTGKGRRRRSSTRRAS